MGKLFPKQTLLVKKSPSMENKSPPPLSVWGRNLYLILNSGDKNLPRENLNPPPPQKKKKKKITPSCYATSSDVLNINRGRNRI